MTLRNFSSIWRLSVVLSLAACGDSASTSRDSQSDGDAVAETQVDSTVSETELETAVGDTQADTAVNDAQADTAVNDTPADTAVNDTPADTAVNDTGADTYGDEPMALRIVTFSDWHGQFDPITTTVDSTTTPPTMKSVAGASVLSAYFEQERAGNPNMLVLSAGDSFGGTPPLSPSMMTSRRSTRST